MSKMWLLGYGMGRTYEVGEPWGAKLPMDPEFGTLAEELEFRSGFNRGREAIRTYRYGEAS